MPGSGFVEQDFGGEPRRFLVRIGQLRKIEGACGTGCGEVARRLSRCVSLMAAAPEKATILDMVGLGLGDWRVDDVREPIFQGLIGGGMNPNEAGALVREWIDDRGFKGLVENTGLALVLIATGVSEPEDDKLGEPLPGVASPATASPSASSMASEPQ